MFKTYLHHVHTLLEEYLHNIWGQGYKILRDKFTTWEKTCLHQLYFKIYLQFTSHWKKCLHYVGGHDYIKFKDTFTCVRVHHIWKHAYTMFECIMFFRGLFVWCVKACHIMYEGMFTQYSKHIYTKFEGKFIQSWKTCLQKFRCQCIGRRLEFDNYNNFQMFNSMI